jgi:flagellar motor switch protein FliN
MSVKTTDIEFSKVEAKPVGDALLPLNMNLIGELEVQLTADIGQAKMTVAQLYSLQKGAVVQLDSAIQQDILLMLHGKVVARGGLVAQDGHFAIEVTDVAFDGANHA